MLRGISSQVERSGLSVADGMPGTAACAMPIAPRSRNSGGAIHLADDAAQQRRRLRASSAIAFPARRSSWEQDASEGGWMLRFTRGVLSRVTDVASKQRVDARGAQEHERRPSSRQQRPRPWPGMPSAAFVAHWLPSKSERSSRATVGQLQQHHAAGTGCPAEWPGKKRWP